MGKRSITKGIKERNNVISDESVDTYVANTYIKEKNGIYELESAIGKNVCQVLREFGQFNIQLKDVASLCGIPTKKLKDMLTKGEEDFENGYLSEEREMFIAYQYGKKSLEGTAVMSLIKKDPEALLKRLNPEVYSDDIREQVVIPNINLNFGSTEKKVDIEDMEANIRAELEKTKSDEE